MIIIIPVVINNNNKWTLYKKIFDGYPVIKLQNCTAGIKNKLTLAKYDELSAKIHIFLNDLEYYHNIPNLDKMFIINIFECIKIINSINNKNKLNKYIHNEYQKYNKFYDNIPINTNCLQIIMKYQLKDVRFLLT